MPRQTSRRPSPTNQTLPISPAIRLVVAFKDAVDQSRTELPTNDEALEVESLLIAAEASYSALTFLADLSHKLRYGGDLTDESPFERDVIDGYVTWLDGAQPLYDRVQALVKECYESETANSFCRHYMEARQIEADERLRRQIERDAPRAEELQRLAENLRTANAADPDGERSW